MILRIKEEDRKPVDFVDTSQPQYNIHIYTKGKINSATVIASQY